MSPAALRAAIVPLYRQLQALADHDDLGPHNAGRRYRGRPAYVALEAQIRTLAAQHWRAHGITITDTSPGHGHR